MDNSIKNDNNATSNALPHYHKCWIDGGIIYIEYVNGVSLADVIAATKEAMELLDKNRIAILPHIILITNIDDKNFTLGITDIAKIIQNAGYVKRVSAIWIVNATSKVRRIVALANNIFFGGRIHLANTVDEAKNAINSSTAKAESILETER